MTADSPASSEPPSGSMTSQFTSGCKDTMKTSEPPPAFRTLIEWPGQVARSVNSHEKASPAVLPGST